jgi:hypothetical protein
MGARFVPKGVMEQLIEQRSHLMDELVRDAKIDANKKSVHCAEFEAAVGCTHAVMNDVDRLYADLEAEHAERVAVLDRSFAELHAKRDAFVGALFERMDAAAAVAQKLTVTADLLRDDFRLSILDASYRRDVEMKRDARLAEENDVRDVIIAWYCPPFPRGGPSTANDSSTPMAKLSTAKLSPAVRARVESLVADFVQKRAAAAVLPLPELFPSSLEEAFPVFGKCVNIPAIDEAKHTDLRAYRPDLPLRKVV